MKTLLIISLLILLPCMFGFGAWHGLTVAEPKIIKHVEPYFIEVPKPTFVTEEVVKEVEKVVEVEKLVPIDIKPRGFGSINNLQCWLDSEEPAYWVYLNKGAGEYTCMDYAARMIRDAALDGYVFSQEGIIRGSRAHVLCKTWLDSRWVYVDPQMRKIVDKDWR